MTPESTILRDQRWEKYMKIKYFSKSLLVVCMVCGELTLSFGQKYNDQTSLSRPKLVVGIVVDQMRYDYLYRYYDKYGKGGFKRLLNKGFNCRNNQYHYGSTSTGGGHASIYSGSSPAIHGIMGNSWFDRTINAEVNCVGDSSVVGVGGRPSSDGNRSPHNLLVTTMTDQLRIATNFRSKTISIALKDRASILPGGHSANAAYWFDGSSGDWITSTYYRQDLPGWLTDFNAKKRSSHYLRQNWTTLLPLEQYTQSTADDLPYERPLIKNTRPIFPHELAGISGNLYGLIASTPWGNSLTREMVVAAMKGENLGKGADTDFLAISFSAPDAVGHAFGINSIEQEDMYLRLDRELEELLSFFDQWVGKDSYTLFLSADHGAMDTPEYLTAHKIPAGRVNLLAVNERIENKLSRQFGPGKYLAGVVNRQIYFNHALLEKKGISMDQVYRVVKNEILTIPGIADVFNTETLGQARINAYQRELFINEIHTKRAGDLLMTVAPGWINKADFGTSHGNASNYDTQVPFLLYGWGVKKGETLRRTYVSDIAPTISALLNILAPSGSIGNVVAEALKSSRKPN